jgi:hypothetical protein
MAGRPSPPSGPGPGDDPWLGTVRLQPSDLAGLPTPGPHRRGRAVGVRCRWPGGEQLLPFVLLQLNASRGPQRGAAAAVDDGEPRDHPAAARVGIVAPPDSAMDRRTGGPALAGRCSQRRRAEPAMGSSVFVPSRNGHRFRGAQTSEADPTGSSTWAAQLFQPHGCCTATSCVQWSPDVRSSTSRPRPGATAGRRGR